MSGARARGMSDDVDDDIAFYWVPGCGNCTRLRGYLTSRGVAFTSINVQADPGAFEAMQSTGHRTLPAVRKGPRFISIQADLSVIDEFLGLSKDTAARDLSAEELVQRCADMLEIAADLAEQLPPEHYDDPTPTMDGFLAPSRFLADGTPYIPHGSYKNLIHHLTQHGEKALRVVLAADGIHDLGFAVDGTGDYNFFGEPEPGMPMYRVAARMRLAAKDLRAWLIAGSASDFSRPLPTHRGMSTLFKFLKIQTISLLQHTRQLEEVLQNRIGISPIRNVADSDLEGLTMPAGVWE